MTDIMQRPRVGPAGGSGGEYRVRESRDWRDLERRLAEDRPLAAYALGHLEWGLFEWARFWIAEGPAGDAVVMHAQALGATTVTIGAAPAVQAIVSLHPGWRRSYLSTASPEHVPALRDRYHVRDTLSMTRMAVAAASFRPVDGAVLRLRGRDAARINALYATEGGPAHYSPASIERAVYYGVVEDGRLVSVAGTHIVAPNQGVGIVGNVMTDPTCRGRGYASRVTSAVTAELLERGCAEVALTVDPGNAPAVAAYTRLGYRTGSPVVEARIERRDTLGIGPALRRRRARARGTPLGDGSEVIDVWTNTRPGEGMRRG